MTKRKQSISARSGLTAEAYADAFCDIAGVSDFRHTFSLSFLAAAQRALKELGNADRCASEWRGIAAQITNEKFLVNADALRNFLGFAASLKITFNYHEKLELSSAFDASDVDRLRGLLKTKGASAAIAKQLEAHFRPASHEESFARLRKELVEPTLTRKDSKPKDWSTEIMISIYAAFLYKLHDERRWHELNDPTQSGQHYEPDYWRHLHRNHPKLFSRQCSLRVRNVSTHEYENAEFLRNQLASDLKTGYNSLSNHGVYAFLMSGGSANTGAAWQLYGDIVLFAEKFRQRNVKQGYFRWQDIEKQTSDYISNLDASTARFDLLTDGYQYLDCFVLGSGPEQSLLILLQKHEADETLIPCPICRSHNVQGNSYSSLGVRSWECNNQFCPDRSKFNRGKRYSFLQLLKQEAIKANSNQISPAHVRKWARDVQPERSVQEVIELLIRHYTLAGDGVELIGFGDMQSELLGRNLNSSEPIGCRSSNHAHDDFLKSPLFSRYMITDARRFPDSVNQKTTVVGACRVMQGDCFEVLSKMQEASIDGAVTSPPYYNAREYSQWENIYTYLYDMFNISSQVHRVLKPGAFYLFNIFDYFDNERSISYSAMGNKRMILGPYMLDIFRRVGFTCVGNVVWDKGEIEGKRAFNNGNFSPYYQAPFNCWEHIFVLQKVGQSGEKPTFPQIARIKPVMKMVRGVNTHGHTAPFPDSIPQMLIERLGSDACVLDPFGGSMTTGRVANAFGIASVCIERDPSYVELGIQMLKNGVTQSS